MERMNNDKSLFSGYPDILKVKDVAKILGVCRHTVYDLIDNKEIHGFRIGRVYRVTKLSVIAYIKKLGQDEK